MSEPNDNIERFFQQGATEGDIRFDETNWEKMNVRLDQELLIRTLYINKVYKRIGAGLMTVILGGLIYFIVQRNPDQITRENQTDNLELPGVAGKEIQPEKQETIRSEDENQDPLQKEEEKSVSRQKTRNEKTSGISIAEATGNTKVSSKTEPQAVMDNTSEEILKILSTESDPLNAKANPFQSEDRLTFNGFNYPLEQLHAPEILPENVEHNENVKRKGREELSRLSVYAAVSPELSSVGFSNFTTPGPELGLGLEFNIARSLSISSGAFWSKKIYLTRGSEYHPPKGYWTNGIVPESTEGKCGVIDIPIVAKYYILNRGRSSVFLSGGVSSYIMLNEDYNFNYNPSDPSLVQGWSTDKNSNYWFSILNFSVGYQFQAGRNTFIQVEPYTKIPLGQVGWGKVNLQSLGLQLEIKYRFSKVTSKFKE